MWDWNPYDAFFRDTDTSQKPLSFEEKQRFQHEILDAIGDTFEANVHPPGRYAQAVLRITPDNLPLPLAQQENSGTPASLKIFKLTPEARREAKRLQTFYLEHHLPRLNGLKSHYGCLQTPSGRLVCHQEWVDGMCFQSANALSLWAKTISPQERLSLVRSFLEGLIFPLWQERRAFWDIRSANFVFDLHTPRVVLIDLDSLAPAFTPRSQAALQKHATTAFKRLRTLLGAVSQSPVSAFSELDPLLLQLANNSSIAPITAWLDDFAHHFGRRDQ